MKTSSELWKNVSLDSTEREKVRLVLDPRGFYRTEPVHQWLMGVDWADGPSATSYFILRHLEKKLYELLAVPKEILYGEIGKKAPRC